MKKRFHKLTVWLLTAAMLMTFMPVTMNAATGGTAPIVTDISFNRDSPAYDEETNTFYVSDIYPFILTVTGENLTQFQDMGGLEALFEKEVSNAGWAVTSLSIRSDTQAVISVNTASLTYILNDPFGSRKATAVMVENGDTQYGRTIYVGITHAPTFALKIKDSAGGAVSHDNPFSNYIVEDAPVTLTVTPDAGYQLERLTVDGTDVIDQLVGDTYTFTMPDKVVEVEATFKPIPTVGVRISAVDADDGTELEGALLQILNPADEVVAQWISGLEVKTVEGLNPDVSYILRSIVAPEGYTVPTDIQFSVDEDGKVNGFGYVNRDGILLVEFSKTVVCVSAVDAENGNAIADARIQVLDSENNVCEEWISDGNVYEIVRLTAGKEYTLRATVAPDGYTIPKDTTFTLEKDGYVSTAGKMTEDGELLVVFDKTVVQISAVDKNEGTKLEGVYIQLLDDADKVVEEWDSDLMVKIIKGLKSDIVYTLHTTVAPDGYLVPADMEFSIDDVGNVVCTGSSTVDADGNTVLLVELKTVRKQIDPDIKLTAPVKNATPQTEIIGEGYTATVEWSPIVTGKFGYNTEYTATITITPDANHTTEGITAYTVTNAKHVTSVSNVITAVFEKTGSKPVSSGGGGGGGLSAVYTVSFETDGGSKVSAKSVARNNKLTQPEAPTKDGFEFAGWYTDKELTNAYDFETKGTKSFTLYAKWTEEKEEEQPSASGHHCPSLKFEDLDTTQWYHFDTDYVIEHDIFKGTTEKTFTPHGDITRAMMITVLYRAEGEPEVTGSTTFEDVDENAYYRSAVVWGQQNGIIKGYSDTVYAPEQPILREQIAAIMHRYAKFKGYDVSIGESTNILSYEDVDRVSEYAIAAMQWAVGSGMILGRSESTLNPQDFAQRVEIAAMLHRFIEANK